MKTVNRSERNECIDNVLLVDKGDTLNEVLSELGFTTEEGPKYLEKRIKSGHHILFTGKSSEVWDWLRKMGYITYSL